VKFALLLATALAITGPASATPIPRPKPITAMLASGAVVIARSPKHDEGGRRLGWCDVPGGER